MNVRAIRLATWFAVFLGTGAAWPDSARAQTRGEEECLVPRESSGLIRGDRVPAGCVMIERPAREPARRPTIVSGHTVVPVLVRSRLFLPDPPFVGVPPGSGAVTGADSLPRVRSGPFGPIERHFGPVIRHFGPVIRHFGPVTRHFGPAP